MGRVILNPDSDSPELLDPKRSGIPVGPGSIVSVRTPGSGGYGNPAERDRALIVHDLEEGMISPESAMRDYGLTAGELEKIKVYLQ